MMVLKRNGVINKIWSDIGKQSKSSFVETFKKQVQCYGLQVKARPGSHNFFIFKFYLFAFLDIHYMKS